MKYFSPEKCAFFDNDIIPISEMPADVISVSDEDYSALMEAQAGGKKIIADSTGKPVAVAQACNSCTCLLHDMVVATETQLGHVKPDGVTVKAASDGTISAEIDLSGKADDSGVVHKAGNETVTGQKTFSMSPLVPTPETGDSTQKTANTAFIQESIADLAKDSGVVHKAGDETITGEKTFNAVPKCVSVQTFDVDSSFSQVANLLLNGGTAGELVQKCKWDTKGTWGFEKLPQIPTAASGDSSSNAASTEFVKGAFSGIDYVVEEWHSYGRRSFYRKWKSGYLEQGGYSIPSSNKGSVTFPIPFARADGGTQNSAGGYTLMLTDYKDGFTDVSERNCTISAKSSTGFSYTSIRDRVYWYACGRGVSSSSSSSMKIDLNTGAEVSQ